MNGPFNQGGLAETELLPLQGSPDEFDAAGPFLDLRETPFFSPYEAESATALADEPMPVPPARPILFAPLPPAGSYWPIVTQNAKGREVAFKRTDGTIVGNSSRMFLARRSDGGRYHVAVDLYADNRDPILACENGTIVNFYHFYRSTYALLVEHDNYVINYGEVHQDSLSVHHLKIGDRVRAGQPIGLAGKMYSSSMLHFEMYTRGTRSNKRYLQGGTPPKELLNPTKYLLHLQRHGGGATASAGSAMTIGKNPSFVIEQNRKFADSIGWGAYIYSINDLLLQATGQSGISLGEQAFAEALLVWQRQQGFAAKDCDGILGPQTWRRMKPLIVTAQEFEGRDGGIVELADDTGAHEHEEGLLAAEGGEFPAYDSNSVARHRENGEPDAEMLFEDTAAYESDTADMDMELLEQEFPAIYPAVQGVSPFALQSKKQWSRSTNEKRPAGWQGGVYGLVVHTTGGSLPGKAIAARRYPTMAAIDIYFRSTGCNYINGWKGIAGGDLVQVANEDKMAYGVGMTEQLNSIDKGNFEKDLPAAALIQWQRRWPGYKNPKELLPRIRNANAAYVHVECLPVVYYLNNRTVTDAAHPPMRAGLRFTKAQHDTIAVLAYDIALRNGWDMQSQWWRTPRLLGHEDLTPLNRHDCSLQMPTCSKWPRAKFDLKECWDPGGLRASPYIDWEYIYQQIEAIVRGGYAAVLSSPIQVAPELSGAIQSYSSLFDEAAIR